MQFLVSSCVPVHMTNKARVPLQTFLLTSSALLLLACGGPSGKPRSYAKPAASQVVTHLQESQGLATSYVAESRMEYWVEKERIKPTVMVMGELGAKIRFNALNPTGDDVAADLACNGTNFQFIDFNHDCQLTGPCTKDAISQLLRVSLAPDDFLLLAVGSTPLIAAVSSELRWDGAKQVEILSLTSKEGHKQTIILDGHKQHWDVLSSTVWNPDGTVDWILTNKDFKEQRDEAGQVFRVPMRTRFEQPEAKAELTIRWIERELNTELGDDKFEMEIPALPRCGES